MPLPYEHLVLTAKLAKASPDALVELQVIGAGLPRTGTSSLHEALCILGYGPCHHMASLFEDPGRAVAFRKAFDGEPTDWRALMAGFKATVDSPGADWVPQLMTAFPRALVILTVRDSPEDWFGSMAPIVLLAYACHYGFWVFPIRFLREQSRVGKRMILRWQRDYGGSAPLGREVYERHNAYIRGLVPKDKLLEFNVKQGWEPLCEFLSVPVPNVPFPRHNDSARFRGDLIMAIRVGQAVWAALVLAVVILMVEAVRRRTWTWLC